MNHTTFDLFSSRVSALPRAAAVLAAAGAALLASPAQAQRQACWDVENVPSISGGYVLPATAAVGQEFVATRSFADAVELQLNTQTAGSATLRVLLRAGSITGPVLGTTGDETVDNVGLPTRTVRFEFGTRVRMQPGRRYVLEVEHRGGVAAGAFLTGFGADTYPRGRAILRGAPQAGDDLWFRVGIGVDRVAIPDQENLGPVSGGFVPPRLPEIGQEFVPAASSLDVVALQINSQGSGDTRARVRVRAGTIRGPILGTSATVTVEGTDVRPVAFRFPRPVRLAAGRLHVLEVVHVGGTHDTGVFTTTTASYGAGAAIVSGARRAGDDLWFRTGLAADCSTCQQDLGFQGPGRAFARMCGTGLGAGEFSDYVIEGAPANAQGFLFFSLPGAPNLRLAGGVLVSGAGYLLNVPFAADAEGRASVRVDGVTGNAEFAVQAAFVVGRRIAMTNALAVRFGR